MKLTRTCHRCKKTKPLTAEFWHQAKARKEGFQYVCILCRRLQSWMADIRRHGITVEEYLKLSLNGCAICGKGSGAKRLSIDHDHSCCPGEFSCGRCIRGVLCTSCNRGIGYLGDNADRLEKAQLYLRSWTRIP